MTNENNYEYILTDYHDDVVWLDSRCCGTSNENERHYYQSEWCGVLLFFRGDNERAFDFGGRFVSDFDSLA